MPSRSAVNEELGPRVYEAPAEFLEGVVLAHRELGPAVGATGVETLLHRHEIHARLLVAREDRPLHGRGPCHRGRSEKWRLIIGTASRTCGLMSRPKATTTPERDPDIDHVVDPIADRKAQLDAAALTGDATMSLPRPTGCPAERRRARRPPRLRPGRAGARRELRGAQVGDAADRSPRWHARVTAIYLRRLKPPPRVAGR